MRYQIWYIPRIQDELVVAQFENEAEAHDIMNELKHKKPKAYPPIWDTKTKKKIPNEQDEYDRSS